MIVYLTHIWDIYEKVMYDERPDDFVLVVPACAEVTQSTRQHKLTTLCIPEACLPRGTNEPVRCEICNALNDAIKDGSYTEDVWDAW